jgi:hypothetical protein
VGKVRLDAPRVLASFLIGSQAGAMRFHRVRLEINLGLKDDKLLRETIWMRADVMRDFEMSFLRRPKKPHRSEGDREGSCQSLATIFTTSTSCL